MNIINSFNPDLFSVTIQSAPNTNEQLFFTRLADRQSLVVANVQSVQKISIMSVTQCVHFLQPSTVRRRHADVRAAGDERGNVKWKTFMTHDHHGGPECANIFLKPEGLEPRNQKINLCCSFTAKMLNTLTQRLDEYDREETSNSIVTCAMLFWCGPARST